MTRPAENNSASAVSGLVALGVLPIFVAEIIAAARAPYWMGMRDVEWVSTLGPPVFYWSFVSILAAAFGLGLSRFFPSERFRGFGTLAAIATSSAILFFALRHGLEPSLRSGLGIGFGTGVGIVLLASTLRSYARFSCAAALVAGIGAVTASALSIQTSAATLVIRVFGLDAAASVAIQYAAVLGSLAVIAGLLAVRRPLVGWSAALAVCLIGAGTPAIFELRAAAAVENRGPNIVLLTADSMRADYASVYGGATPTPMLEGLARSGAKFDQAISLAPWTVPALAGLFSSKYPPSVSPAISTEERGRQLSLYGQIPAYWLGEGGESIARRLGDRGYDTAAFIANFAMRKQRWLIDDFASHLVMSPSLETIRGPFWRSPFLSSLVRSLRPSLYQAHPFDTTRAVTELAQGFIRNQKGDRFFLWAHYLDPHTPYDPPQALRTESGPFPFYPYEDRLHHGSHTQYVQSLYAGEIRYVDEAVGRVLETLKELGLTDRTYVVFASDHGEELWDHAGFGHGHSVFDELLRVPLIIAGPGIAPQTVTRTVSTIDLLPTLADWADLRADPGWRGASWAEALRKGSFERAETPVFAQATGVLPPPPEPLQTVILGAYKLIRGMESGEVRLYDRSTDPGEHLDRAEAESEIVEQLQGALDRWSKSFPVTFDTFGEQGKMPEPDPETIENLKALGYLPNDSP